MYRFLIIDDNEDDAIQLSFLIEEDFPKYAKCETAGTCRGALEWLDPHRHKPFDAVLLDLNLPDSEGVETFRAIHAAVPDTPVVVYSGRDDERGTRDLMIEEGAEGYLTKGNLKAIDVFQTLCDAAKRKEQRARLHAAEEEGVVEEAESSTRKLLEATKDSSPPVRLAAQATAAETKLGKLLLSKILEVQKELHDHRKDSRQRISQAFEATDTANRFAINAHRAAQLLHDKSERLEETDKQLVSESKLTRQQQKLLEERNKALEEAVKDNKKKLALISIGVAALGYTAGDKGGWLLDLLLSLVGG